MTSVPWTTRSSGAIAEQPSVNARVSKQPRDRDRGDDEGCHDDVPGGLLELVHSERDAEVVRHEQRREGDHDQVVEEQRPAGDEADQVVEGTAGERLGATRLGDCGGALGVRERDQQEDRTGSEEDERRQAERSGDDDPEREVDRRADLAVRDCEQLARAEDPLEAADLARHQRDLASARRRSARHRGRRTARRARTRRRPRPARPSAPEARPRSRRRGPRRRTPLADTRSCGSAATRPVRR